MHEHKCSSIGKREGYRTTDTTRSSCDESGLVRVVGHFDDSIIRILDNRS